MSSDVLLMALSCYSIHTGPILFHVPCDLWWLFLLSCLFFYCCRLFLTILRGVLFFVITQGKALEKEAGS